MTIADQVREYFLKPASLDVELTRGEIAKAIRGADDLALANELNRLARTGELKRAKNSDGKYLYRYDPKYEPKRRKKMQRKTAKRASHRGRRRLRTVRAEPGRWALTEDGAFLLLGVPEAIEISRERARALVGFIRTLDEGAA